MDLRSEQHHDYLVFFLIFKGFECCELLNLYLFHLFIAIVANISFSSGNLLQSSGIMTAPAYVIPSLDSVAGAGKRMNGSMGNTNTFESSSGSPQIVQFRTLLPSRPTTTISTASLPLITSSSIAGKLPVPPRRSSLVMDASPGVGVPPRMVMAASQAQQTLTCCLGTLVTASAGSTPVGSPQVLFYSLAPPPPPVSNSSTNAVFPLSQLPSATVTVPQFTCQWAGTDTGGGYCGKAFATSDQLFSHVYSVHFTPIRGQESVSYCFCSYLHSKLALSVNLLTSWANILDMIDARFAQSISVW